MSEKMVLSDFPVVLRLITVHRGGGYIFYFIYDKLLFTVSWRTAHPTKLLQILEYENKNNHLINL